MNSHISKQQYYFLVQLVIVLILSSIAAKPTEQQSPAVHEQSAFAPHEIQPEQQHQRQNLISSGLLANGYVPIIISKSTAVATTTTGGGPPSISSPRLEQQHHKEIHPSSNPPSTNTLQQNVSETPQVPLLERNVTVTLLSSSSNSSSRASGTPPGNGAAGVVFVVNQTSKLNYGSAIASSSSSASSSFTSFHQSGASSSSSSTTSSSIFNVIDVVNSLDIRLKHIRNIELGVTYVQEIFDTLGFTTDTDAARVYDLAELTVASLAVHIRHKLDVVHEILDNLSDFIAMNVTALELGKRQRNGNDTSSSKTQTRANLFLNTLIQPCPFDDFSLEQNYNKKQIQILNYLKISGFQNDLNFTINSQIVNALRRAILFNGTLLTTTENQNQRNESSSTTSSPMSSSSSSSPISGKFAAQSSRQWMDAVDTDDDEQDDDDAEESESPQYSSKSSNFKHVFFLSRDDHASDHNCQYYFNDMNFRHLYTDAIRSKHVFLVIDRGHSMSREQLDLSKQFVTNIIQILSDRDTITIVLVDSDIETIQLSAIDDATANATIESDWRSTFRYNATMDNKDELMRRVGLLTPSKTTTNHSLAFNHSFELLEKQNVTATTFPLTFVYVTRGLLSQFTEPETVLKTIARGQERLSSPVVINTCAVILDEKRVMYEKQFLRDIAQQNYSRYNINTSSWYHADRHNIRGNMYVITKRHPELIVKTSTSIFSASFQLKFVSNSIQYHLPVLDYNTKDMIVSITKPIAPYGVAGVNMYLNDLTEEITYYRKPGDSYAFLTDINGWVLNHPAYSRPVATLKNPYPVDIGVLEPAMNGPVVEAPEVESLRSMYLKEPSGSLTVKIMNDSGHKKVKYSWQRIYNAYIVCVVTTRPRSDDTGPDFTAQWKLTQQHSHLSGGPTSGTSHRFERYQMYNVDPVPSSELLYHRIDLIPPPKSPVCRHFRQIATLDTGTIFLSASAFKSPFVYFKNNRGEMNDRRRRTHNAQSIMAYIKDITNLLANPGLQPQIRRDVSALFHVMAYLKKRHLDSGALKKFIIRRYVATMNGVLQVYPGCILGSDLEPSRRPWFRKAVRYPGRIVTTEPYLDAGGAGYIVTISHTIFEGKANALHNVEKDTPLAVVALDVPFAFFYRMLLESTAVCSESFIKCLLMEDRGYLLAHPSIMDPSTPTMNARRPLEHITHKESFVANDMLNHKTLVRKKACATFQNRIVQRYYDFNTSLVNVLTNNVVHGDRTKYQITAIPGTNLFAVILNSTCDGGAFCPCSTVDRICLNCNRMDQADCECPCECPLRVNRAAQVRSSLSSSSSNTTNLDYCEPEIEGLAIVNSLSYDWNLVVKPCTNIKCELYTTHAECLGVMGCEWCQLDVDLNPFPTPFCTAQNSCFNGVLGAATPYGDGDLGPAIIEPTSAPAYSAIGPAGGTVIALCVMVGIAVYCYRLNMDNSLADDHHLYGGDSMHDDNYDVPRTRLYVHEASPHDDTDLSGGGMMLRNLLPPLANANDISPYHMSTGGGGYRRPPHGESDHGYSTMTPHEDSENLCLNLIEPLINNQKRFSMSADTMSINTSVSSPTNRPMMPMQATCNDGQSDDHDVRLKGETITTPKRIVEGQTIIPELMQHNRILAPVTVHRHMEAS